MALIIEAYDQDKAKLQSVNPCGLVPQLVLYTPFLIVKIVSVSNLEGWRAQRCYPAWSVDSAEASCCWKWSVIRVTLRFDDSIVFPCSFARGCESFGGVVGFGNYKL